MLQLSGTDMAAFSIELVNLMVFLTVGVTLIARSYDRKAPKTKRFVMFVFFWAGSQFVDILSWLDCVNRCSDSLVLVLRIIDTALCYASFFMFLYITIMVVETAAKVNEIWKYTLYIGLATVLVLNAAVYITGPETELGSTFNDLYMVLSTLLLAAEFVLVITNRKGFLKIEVCAATLYTLGELTLNIVIRDADLRYALLSSVGALYSIMVFGAIIQRLILLNISENNLALEKANDEKEKERENARKANQTLDKYLGHDVAELLLSDSITHGENRQVIVLFADIEGFTSMCEGRGPEDVMSILNLFLETMANAILENEGTVDKFIGDCTMGLWNATVDQPNGPYLACHAAMAIKDGVKVANQIIEAEYGFRLEVNIGISVGPAVIGNVGSATRKSFTALGDTVNIASRIQNLADHGEIFVTRGIRDILCDRGTFVKRNSVVLKGKSIETEVFELTALKD